MNNNTLLKIGQKVLVKKCTWKTIKGVIHRADSAGEIFTRKGDKNHTNVHMYGINIPHGQFFTDNNNNEFTVI